MKRSLYLILAALAATPAGAATLAETVDLRTVLRFARDASIPVLVEQSNVQVAIAERSEARALPNPTLSYNRQHQPGRLTNFDSDRAQDWTFEQPLLLGGQRKARMQAASAAIDAASARVTLTRHAVAADVASAYVELLLAQERVAALKAGLDELTGLRDVVEGRRAGGLASDYDVLRVDVEESSWRARVAEAESTLVEKQTALALTLGVANWRPRASGRLEPLVSQAPDASTPHPGIDLARREESVAAALANVAKRERMPAVSVNVSRFWTSSPYGGTTSIGLAVEMPIFDRRQGAFDKAAAQAGTASLERELAEAKFAAEIDSYTRLVAQRTLGLEDFQRRATTRSSHLNRMAKDAYRAGKSSIAELLDATRSSVELTLAEQELIAVLMDSQLKLESAKGNLLRRTL